MLNAHAFTAGEGTAQCRFRDALRQQLEHDADPCGWFQGRLEALAGRLVALGIYALPSGNGVDTRFLSDDGEECLVDQLPSEAQSLARQYVEIDSDWAAAQSGHPPTFSSVQLDPDQEVFPLTDQQRVEQMLLLGFRGQLAIFPEETRSLRTPATGPATSRRTP